jgi:hypothetical protein
MIEEEEEERTEGEEEDEEIEVNEQREREKRGSPFTSEDERENKDPNSVVMFSNEDFSIEAFSILVKRKGDNPKIE